MVDIENVHGHGDAETPQGVYSIRLIVPVVAGLVFSIVNAWTSKVPKRMADIPFVLGIRAIDTLEVKEGLICLKGLGRMSHVLTALHDQTPSIQK